MAPPTRPIGQPGGLTPTWTPGLGPGWAATGWEDNPELQFPQSVTVYDRMRRTDTQVASILRAVALPLRAVTWTLDSDPTTPEITAFVADQLNLNTTPGRRPGGINWDEHLRQALLALAWGFHPFEVVYRIAPSSTPGAPPLAAHLAQLASRPPRTLLEVRATRDGDLAGVIQAAPGTDTLRDYATTATGVGLDDVFIPRDRLAWYVLDREGADWTGTSLLRAAFKDWWLKEQLVRAAGQAVERNSMGLPVVAYQDEGDRQLALDIATAARAGATAGVAVPMERMEFSLVGVTGSTVDPLPLIRYHDQAMTRSALAMFLDLGHDNGARSLGDTFVDFFTASLRSIAEWVASTATEEIIRPLVALNFGPDAPAPRLTCETITARHAATADALKTLVDAGILTPDGALESQTRRAYGLPDADPDTARDQPTSRDPGQTAVDVATDQAFDLVEELARLRARQR